MFMKGGDYSRSLTMLAYMLADRYKWKLVWGDRGPCIDMRTRTIYMPAHWCIGSPSDAKLLLGIFLHELLGHGVSTDPDLPNAGPGVGNLEMNLRNVLEDVRIERSAAQQFAGVAGALAETVQEMHVRKLWECPGPNSTPGAILVMGLCHILRSEILSGQARTLGKFSQQWNELGKATFGPLWDRILQVGRKVSRARLDTLGTSEAHQLAADIMRLLRDAEEQPEKAASGDPGDGASAPGGGGGEGTPQATDGDNESGENEPAKSEEDGGADSTAPSTGQPKQPPEIDPAQLKQAVQQALASQTGSSELTDVLAAAIEASPVVQAGRTPGRGAGGGLARLIPRVPDTAMADKYDAAATILVNTTGRSIDKLLEAQTTEKRWHTTSGVRLSASRLPRIALGDLRVFARQEDAIAVSTAAAILMDVSGSMGSAMQGWHYVDSSCESLAVSTGYAMGRLLERYGAAWCLASFASDVSIWKLFEDNRIRARQYAPGNVGGGTTTSGAILQLLPVVGRRSEDKKLIIVVTDGEPNDLALALAAIEECYAYGVQVLTLIVGTDGAHMERDLRRRNLPVGRARKAEDFREAVANAVTQAALLGLDLRKLKRAA